MSSKTAGYAARIVELHEGSKNIYKLNREELEQTIGRADIAGKKVALISIAGAFRKGKSFLLNFLVTFLEHLHKGGSESDKWFDETTTLDNFNWRGGADRDTNGIFIWSVPYILEDQNKGEIVVFLMDTQGTFDHQSTVQECATIFALSTLLSSVQIFNLSTQIQEDDLNNLRLFTEYAQLTKDENQRRAPFQKLLFLVRDWPNSDQYEYGYEGGQEYLEKLLRTTPKQKKELKTLRENIKPSFETLEAFLMPHPGLRIARNNSEKVLGKVEEDFAEKLSDFVPSLFEEGSLEAKKIGGKAITCSEMTALFKELMTIFNSDDLPEPKTILEATVDSINLSAEQKSRAAYDQHMKEKFLPSLNDLSAFENIHKTAEKLALDIFEERPKLGEESTAKFNKENLTKYFECRHDEFKRTVEQNIQMKEKERRMEEQKKRIAAEQEAERQRIKIEEERIQRQKIENERRQREEADRLRREREEQERNRREQEERLRKEKERQQREYEERQARLKREQEEQERNRREQEERLRKEKERQQREYEERQARLKREQEEQERRNQEERRRIQAEREEMARQQREAEERRKEERRKEAQQRELMAALQSQSYTSSCFGGGGYSPSYSGGGGYSPSSYSGGGFFSGGGGSSNIRQETITIRGTPQVRYRDMDTGRFTKNPNA